MRGKQGGTKWWQIPPKKPDLTTATRNDKETKYCSIYKTWRYTDKGRHHKCGHEAFVEKNDRNKVSFAKEDKL